jgi:hypothetical protein
MSWRVPAPGSEKKFQKGVDAERSFLHNLILVADDANESSEIRRVWRKMLCDSGKLRNKMP